MKQFCALSLMVVAATAGATCGKGGDPGAKRPPRSAFEQDPCALVTKAEAEAALEMTLKAAMPPDANLCDYYGDEPATREQGVQVTLARWAAIHGSADVPRDQWSEYRDKGGPPPGLGDTSAWEPKPPGWTPKLLVIQRPWLLGVEVMGDPRGPEHGKTVALAVAKIALARLRQDMASPSSP